MDLDDDLPEDTPDLVQQLVREAGRILEDASLEFAMALPLDERERKARLRSLGKRTEAVQALILAAVTLHKSR